MSSSFKNDQLSARVSVKVPRPDSLVEVRVTPPDSDFQIKVSPGDEVIELLIRPGASMVEVRISPPGENEEAEDDRLPNFDSAAGDNSPAEDEVVPGVSRAEFAAMVEEEESAEAKKLLDQMAADEAAAQDRPGPAYRLPDEVKSRLEADQDDEAELKRLGEVLAPEAPLATEVDPEEAQAQELLGDQAAEVLSDSFAPAGPAEPEEDEEPALAGPDPAELAELDLPSNLAEAESAATEPPMAAGPAPEELVEPDEFDQPQPAEPEADQAAEAAPPVEPIPAELDEFDQPEIARPTPAESAEAVPSDEMILAQLDELDQPDLEEPAVDELAPPAEPEPSELDEFDQLEPEEFFGQLTLENNDAPAPQPPAPSAGPSASQTLEWVPVNPNGTPVEDDEPIAPEVIGAAALDALARLNLAVREEKAAVEAAIQPVERPKSGEATAAATSLSSADSTIMVEMYDDYEPGPNPADTVTPPPEDELMDLSQVEKDEDLAIEPIDVDGLGELDLEKSHFAETRNGRSAIKARPMVQVIPGNTVVPE